jgi:hypothetical protein
MSVTLLVFYGIAASVLTFMLYMAVREYMALKRGV